MERAVEDLISALARIKRYAEEYNAELTECSVSLKHIHDIGAITDIVSTLAKGIKKSQSETKLLHKRVGEGEIELQNLRHELELARRRAYIDPLTKLYNRRFWEENHSLVMTKQPICIMVLDIDYFKSINDNHGHIMGDHVLRMLGRTISQHVREDDVVIRWGGEEFVIILTESDINAAKVVAERICSFTRRRNIIKRQGNIPIGSITLSIGIAQFRSDEHWMAVIDRADNCLYKAKADGRDRIVTEDQLDPHIEKDVILI